MYGNNIFYRICLQIDLPISLLINLSSVIKVFISIDGSFDKI